MSAGAGYTPSLLGLFVYQSSKDGINDVLVIFGIVTNVTITIRVEMNLLGLVRDCIIMWWFLTDQEEEEDLELIDKLQEVEQLQEE